MAQDDGVLVARSTCRVCQARLEPVLDLGSLYLSDFPHGATTKAHPAVPLVMARCTGPCGLVQLCHTTPSDWLYGQYWYRSGVNESMVAELRDIVVQALKRVEVPPHGVVVDIGANDGTLLAQYETLAPKAIRVGYEPARNLYEACRPHASVLYPQYFRVAEPWASSTRAKVVTAIAMFYDLDEPHQFVEDVTKVLAPDGVFIIQQAYLPSMLANTAYDNCCHEHLEYYSLTSLVYLLHQHGLEVMDVELRAINGGSFRVYVQSARGDRIPSPRVAACLEEERVLFGIMDKGQPWVYHAFATAVEHSRQQTREVLAAYQHAGGVVDLYAASTKVNTLLQFCGIDSTHVRQAWERSPEKWGRHVGVSRILIVSEAVGREDPPSALLVGAWQWRDYFVKREQAYVKAGGRLIFPLPSLEVVHG